MWVSTVFLSVWNIVQFLAFIKSGLGIKQWKFWHLNRWLKIEKNFHLIMWKCMLTHMKHLPTTLSTFLIPLRIEWIKGRAQGSSLGWKHDDVVPVEGV